MTSDPSRDLEDFAFWVWVALPREREQWLALDLPGTLPLNPKAEIISDWAREAILRGDHPADDINTYESFAIEIRWLRRVCEKQFAVWQAMNARRGE